VRTARPYENEGFDLLLGKMAAIGCGLMLGYNSKPECCVNIANDARNGALVGDKQKCLPSVATKMLRYVTQASKAVEA
jgi:hypothetical protein